MSKSILTKSALLVGCLLMLGCRSMRESEQTEFLKPLNNGNSLTRPSSRASDLSEREICVETAKMVAEKGHATEAIKLYEKAERLDPGGRPFDLELAPLYLHEGKVDLAIRRYRQAIASGAANDEVFNNLAWTFIESGRHPEALETIRQGFAVSPESVRLKATRAVILHKTGDRDGSFNEFKELYGESAAHHNIAVLELDSENIDAAIEHASLAASFPECSEESIKLRDSLQSRIAEENRTLVR